VADAQGGQSSETITLHVSGPVHQDDVQITVGQNSGLISLNLAEPTHSNPGAAVQTIRVLEVPNAARGVVYHADATTPVAVNDELTSAELTALLFEPVPGVYGDAGKLRYLAEDGSGGQVVNRVFFTIDGAPQVGADKSLHVAQDSFLNPLALAAPSDPEGGPLTVTALYLPEPEFGLLTLADGTVVTYTTPLTVADLTGLRFTPATGVRGFDLLFSYQVSDAFETPQSAMQTLFVLIEGQPTVDADRTLTVLKNSAALELNLSAPAQLDEDSFAPSSVTLEVTVQAVPDPAKGYVALGGTPVTAGATLSPVELTGLSFQPATGFAGPAGTFEYTATNDTGGTASQTITFFVDALPEPVGEGFLPIAANSSFTSLGQQQPSDPDGGAVTVQVTAVPNAAQGSVYRADHTPVLVGSSLSPAEVAGLLFKPVAAFTGDPGSFTYTVTDLQGHVVAKTVSINVRASSGDLRLTLSGTPASVQIGQTVTYTFTAKNLGPAGAREAQVSEILPDSFQVVSATSATGTASVSGGLLVWRVGDLAANQTATLSLVVRPGSVGTYPTAAQITGVEPELDTTNNSATTTTQVTPDTTPPTATVGVVGTSGSVVYVPVRLRDAGSGVAQVKLTSVSTNVRLEWDGPSGLVSVPIGGTITISPAAADTTVRAVKLNSSARAVVELRLTDAAGNSALVDPVVANLELKRGRQITRTFNKVPDFEHYLTLQNGTPGLTSVKIWVNGKRVAANDLTNGQELRLDVKQWMKMGKNNTVRLVANGPQGATAVLLIGDSSLAAPVRIPAGLNAEFAP
jgi:uncharacterized repeat protein (TIGR01451 family)